MSAIIDRHFVRIPAGRVHYRSAGAEFTGVRTPLYMAHSGPGSSAGLEPLIASFGGSRPVIAPDMMGNGDSDAHPKSETEIKDYADTAVALLDKLGIEKVDFYGDHTGAHIGCELAIHYPHRVRRLVLDGITLFEPELKAEMLEHYTPKIEPDDFGGHLAWAWTFVRELFVHFPHYRQDPAHRLNVNPIPPPAIRQRLVLDLLKALPTYHIAYQAAFKHDAAARLPLLTCPTLTLGVEGDPVSRYLDKAAELTPGAKKILTTRMDRTAAILAFLDAA